MDPSLGSRSLPKAKNDGGVYPVDYHRIQPHAPKGGISPVAADENPIILSDNNRSDLPA